MTPFTPFHPGEELRCEGCEMKTGGLVDCGCLVAEELRADGEWMSPNACPEPAFCPICSGPLPCPTCLAELRVPS